MVSTVKFDSVVMTKPAFQKVLKNIREYVSPLGISQSGLKIHRLVEGYDVTINDSLILKARLLPRGYFVQFSPGLFEKEVITANA